MKIAVVAEGDPYDATTNSGVASGLIDGLLNDVRVDSVVGISGRLGIWGRLVGRLLSFRGSRTAWNEEYLWGGARIWLKSIKRDRVLRAEKPDLVVHVRGIYRPSKFPYVAFIDTTVGLRQQGWTQRSLALNLFAKRQRLEKVFLERSALVATVAEYVAEDVAAGAASVRRIETVGAGLTPMPVTETIGHTRSTQGPLRVLFVGKDLDRKGGRELIAAVEQLRLEGLSIELDVVGATVEADSDWLRWHGLVTDREQLSRIYADADVFCLPAHFEPFGLVVLEAMSHGLPCVVSSVGVLPELVVNEENGLIVPPRSTHDLCDALRRLMDAPQLRRQYGAVGAARVRQYTWPRVADRLLSAIDLPDVVPL